MTGPTDTIREALDLLGPVTRPRALAALTEVEHQLAEQPCSLCGVTLATGDCAHIKRTPGRVTMTEAAHERLVEELTEHRNNEARAVAAETALAEANDRLDLEWRRALAAEQRANDLADALREILRRPRAWAHVQAIARAALDRHTP